jgi:hypothetical protein
LSRKSGLYLLYCIFVKMFFSYSSLKRAIQLFSPFFERGSQRGICGVWRGMKKGVGEKSLPLKKGGKRKR